MSAFLVKILTWPVFVEVGCPKLPCPPMVNVESIEPLMFPLDVICEVVVKSPSIRTLEEPVDSAPIAKLPLEPLIKYKLSPPASENIIF